MPPKLKEIFLPVRDEEHWKEVTSHSNRRVTLVDLFYPWFGRCDALDEAFRGLYMTLEDPDKKIQYLHADLSKVPVFPEAEQPKPTAKPRFLIYLNGEKKEDISGANYSLMKDKILALVDTLGDVS
eukprot:TRINITY_DN873_c0_g1_i1.p3 TRINITY_DN873_c0_g1~~TRINITY_DN873_c0_g1_i1.p3  ORF type:complete len:126 (+),score=40.06 TRINITY_DN873_c0_g1_i1:110-487(+)